MKNDPAFKVSTLTKNSSRCGSEADTPVMRKNSGPLGKTEGGGEVDAATAVATFMGTGGASRIKRDLVGKRVVDLGAKLSFIRRKLSRRARNDDDDNDSSSSATDAVGTETPEGTVENGVAQSAGTGATSGLPTVGADGVISMTIHQVCPAHFTLAWHGFTPFLVIRLDF